MTSTLKIKPPTPIQLERLRLLLSTYQDGTGMLHCADGSTLPGWRDFERSVALAFGGKAQESKSIFDVLILPPVSSKKSIGISCKMRKELNQALKYGKVVIELSNSAGKFWDVLSKDGMRSMADVVYSEKAGKLIIDLVGNWHDAVKENVDLERSFYLVLQYNSKSNDYKLYQFPLLLPQPQSLTWRLRESKSGNSDSRCLIGLRGDSILLEWYGSSGGQLKYYPTTHEAVWQSDVFKLEPLPHSESGYGIVQKAQTYFPSKWPEIS